MANKSALQEMVFVVVHEKHCSNCFIKDVGKKVLIYILSRISKIYPNLKILILLWLRMELQAQYEQNYKANSEQKSNKNRTNSFVWVLPNHSMPLLISSEPLLTEVS